MRHSLLVTALVAVLFVASSVPALAQLAPDKIKYLDRKTGKEAEASGKITDETPAKIVCKQPSGRSEEIPAADVIEVTYAKPPAITFGTEMQAPIAAEEKARRAAKPDDRKRYTQDAIKSYREVAAKMGAEGAFAARYYLYRATMLQVFLADQDATQLPAAIEALQTFKKDHAAGWELIPAVKALVRLLDQKGDAAGTRAVFDELSDNAAIPKEVRQDFGLVVVRYLLRQGKTDEARKKATAISTGVGRDDPLAQRVRVCLLECNVVEKKLDGVEDELKAMLSGADAQSKGMIYNVLGDYYRVKGQPNDALWAYLWVDVVYHQDHEEAAKALYYLAKVFGESRNDTVRTRECLERLYDEKQFGGTEYHRRALAEKPASGG
jgi:hypothetical protein